MSGFCNNQGIDCICLVVDRGQNANNHPMRVWSFVRHSAIDGTKSTTGSKALFGGTGYTNSDTYSAVVDISAMLAPWTTTTLSTIASHYSFFYHFLLVINITHCHRHSNNLKFLVILVFQ